MFINLCLTVCVWLFGSAYNEKRKSKTLSDDKLCSKVYGFGRGFISAAKRQLILRGFGYG